MDKAKRIGAFMKILALLKLFSLMVISSLSSSCLQWIYIVNKTLIFSINVTAMTSLG